jgi:hypothetical protein
MPKSNHPPRAKAVNIKFILATFSTAIIFSNFVFADEAPTIVAPTINSQAENVSLVPAPPTQIITPEQTTKLTIPYHRTQSTEADFSQLFYLQAGAMTPRQLTVSNGDYSFNYDSASISSLTFQAGWAYQMFQLGGTWSFEENLGYSSFSGTSSTPIGGKSQNEKLNLYVASLDTRIMYSATWLPWHRLIPFVDGGYQYSFYDQVGDSDLASAQGSTGNWTSGAGLRFWLNRGSFTSEDYAARFINTPIFLTAKVNWTYSNSTELDLGSRSYLFGVVVGI